MSHRAARVLSMAGLIGLLGLAVLIDGALSSGRADYKIMPGDVVGLSVIGVPDLTADAPVEADGRAVLPLLGPVKVGGLSAEEATARVRAILPGKEFNRRLSDGRDIPVILSPEQVSLTVAEYRPVYVNGDVGRPGALAYQPDLTIRKAIAFAGGLGRAGTEPDDPAVLGEVTGEYRSLSVENAHWQETVVRLQAELDRRPHVDVTPLAEMGVAPVLDKETIERSDARLNARTEDLRKERTYLGSAADREAQRAQTLGQQKNHDMEGLKIDTADLQRYQQLFSNGEVAIPTMSLARRTVLASSTRALQTSAALASVLAAQSADKRRLERMGDIRRIDLLKDLQTATLALGAVQARLDAVKAKMRYLGVSPTSRAIDDAARLTVTRTSDGELSRIEALPDDRLQPGDVLDVVQEETQP